MKRMLSVLLGGGGMIALGVLLNQTGLLRFSGPDFPDINQVDASVTVPEEAQIVAIEPISLDCRARVHARVPVVGTRRHEAFGHVYRTDRVTLDAVGDVDTCVDGNGTTISRQTDGRTDIAIDGQAVTFVRPRVDMVATGDSLTVERGPIGKITDAFPWVDDNLGLTPLAYAYAQNVIGSSQCMQTAYAVTENLLLDAYRRQLIDQGVDPDQLSVRIVGQPDFTEPDTLDMGDVDLEVGQGDVTCSANSDLGRASLKA